MDKEIIDYVKSLERVYGWFEKLEYKNNNFRVLHYFYSKAKKYKTTKIALGYIESENGRNYANDNLVETYLTGYRVLFDNSRSYYYGECNKKPRMKRVKWNCAIANFNGILHQEEFKKCEQFKYLKFEGNNSCKTTMDFIKRCRKYTYNVEILQKMGLSKLICQMRFLEMSLARKKQFQKFYVANKNEIIDGYFDYHNFVYCIKHNITMETYNAYQWLDYGNRYNSNEHSIKDNLKLYHYLKKQKIDISSYFDYIDACNYLKQKHINYFPTMFNKAHDETIEKMHLKKHKGLNRKLLNVSKKYKLKLEGYEIIIPQDVKTFMEIGKEMHNCVGRMYYDKKMAEGKDLIFAFKKDGVYFACCEYDFGNKAIMQLYGRSNKSVPSDFRERVFKSIPKQILKGE